MHLVKIYSPEGELFEVPKARVVVLLAKEWTLTAPAPKVKAEETPVRETRVRLPKAATSFKDETVVEEAE